MSTTVSLIILMKTFIFHSKRFVENNNMSSHSNNNNRNHTQLSGIGHQTSTHQNLSSSSTTSQSIQQQSVEKKYNIPSDMNKGFMASYLKFLQGERDSKHYFKLTHFIDKQQDYIFLATSPPPTQTTRGGRKSTVWQSAQAAKNINSGIAKKANENDSSQTEINQSTTLPKDRKRKNNQNNKNDTNRTIGEECIVGSGLSLLDHAVNNSVAAAAAASVIMSQQQGECIIKLFSLPI
jgi:hypothetical protein